MKLETEEVSRRSRATIDSKKKSTKKRDTHAGLLFCQSKPIAFSPFLSPPSPLFGYHFRTAQFYCSNSRYNGN